MERALVIRYGNPEIANGIADAMESPILSQLRAELGVSKHARGKEYERKIRQARKKYAVKPMSKLHRTVLGFLGMLALLKEGM